MRADKRFRYVDLTSIALRLEFDPVPHFGDSRGAVVDCGRLEPITQDAVTVIYTEDSDNNLISITSDAPGPLLFDGDFLLVDGENYLFSFDPFYDVFDAPLTHRITAQDVERATGLLFTRATIFGTTGVETTRAVETQITRF